MSHGLSKELQDASFKLRLQDRMIFDVHESLKTGRPSDCFLLLAKQASSSKLMEYDRLMDVCKVVSDRVERETSGNPNAKYGIRYTKAFLDFMIVMRSRGQNSSRQYEIFAAEFAGPSSRHLRCVFWLKLILYSLNA